MGSCCGKPSPSFSFKNCIKNSSCQSSSLSNCFLENSKIKVDDIKKQQHHHHHHKHHKRDDSKT